MYGLLEDFGDEGVGLEFRGQGSFAAVTGKNSCGLGKVN